MNAHRPVPYVGTFPCLDIDKDAAVLKCFRRMNSWKCGVVASLYCLFLAFVSGHITSVPAFAQVISEFLAQNNGLLQDEDGDTPDWIEIHNPGSQPLNLLNWSLTDSSSDLVKWRFPATNLPPGDYLVVFASEKNRRVPGAPLHTNFKLALEGEYLALVGPDNSQVNSSFAPIYPPQLPNISYGTRQGSAWALIYSEDAPVRVFVPNSGALGLDWVNPEFDDSTWRLGKSGVGFESSPAEYATLIRTDVRAEMANRTSCYIRVPFVIGNPAELTDWRLLVRFDDGFIAYLNGQEIARRNAPPDAAWDSAATANHPDEQALVPEEFSLMPLADLIVRGTNVLAIHGLNTSTSSSDFLALGVIEARQLTAAAPVPVYMTTPTPGAINLGGTERLGPIISDVTHSPASPEPGEDLLVSANVVAAFAAVGSVQLRYRVMFGSENTVSMMGDGAHQDGAAGDGRFSAVIPGSGFQPGQMIRYYVAASDNAQGTSRLPLFLDATDSAEYFGTIVRDSAIDSKLPVLSWFVPSPDQANTRTGVRSAVYFLGEFYDNVLFSLHGQSSSGFPKHSYNVDFTRDHRFLYSTDDARVKDIKLLTNWGDKSRLRNTLAYELIRESGSAGHFAFPIRVEQNGEFHAILDLVEDADDRWLERLGLNPEGALYKMYNSLDSAGGNEKKTRKEEDTADLQAFIDNLNESRSLASRALYAYDNIDLPQTVSYFVGLALISSQDHGHKNYYLYRDSAGTGEWAPLPWDVDLCLGRNWTDSGGYFTDTLYQNNTLTFYNSAQQNKPANRLYNLIFKQPEFRRMYLRRLRTVMDEVLQPPQTPATTAIIESKARAWLDLMDPPAVGISDADLDYQKWGSWGNRNSMRAEAQRMLEIHLPGRRSFLHESASAILEGERIPPSQPPDVLVQFGRIEFNPASGDQEQEFIELLNGNAIAVDLSGWHIEGGITFQFRPGTVVPSMNRLYLSPNPAAFRARANSPRGGEGLFVEGGYGGRLSARGESLRLLDKTGRVVARTNYPGSPTLAQEYLRITELMYHPAPPGPGSAFSDGDFEFLELFNSGPVELDLRGVRFTRGINFTFALNATTRLSPGEYLVLVRNPAAFVTRYGSAPRVGGTYVGALDNSGEVIRLEDAVGEEVFEFSYSREWYPSSDGHGPSLESVQLHPDPNLAAFWRESQLPGGSPGTGGLPAFGRLRARLVRNEIVVSIRPEQGKPYSLMRTSTLVEGGWQPTGLTPQVAVTGELEWQLPITEAGSQFYQVSSP